MKIYIDELRLYTMMKKQGITSYKQLGEESGLSVNTLWCALNKKHASLNTVYLLSDRLGCRMEDIIFVEWGE